MINLIRLFNWCPKMKVFMTLFSTLFLLKIHLCGALLQRFMNSVKFRYLRTIFLTLPRFLYISSKRVECKHMFQSMSTFTKENIQNLFEMKIFLLKTRLECD